MSALGSRWASSILDSSDSLLTASHALIRRTAAFIYEERLIDPGCALLLGVSGGPDSVALLHAMTTLTELLRIDRITVLHFNHRLRGHASDDDQVFVLLLSEKLGLNCLTGGEDVRGFADANGVSVEMAARMCRHRFFEETLAAGAGDRLALAHTANDQAEEVLLRLFRGTGPSGMAGMLPKNGRGIIRPLLFAWRSEILDYLHAGGYDFREDESNRESFCQRNALRNELIPLIRHHFHGRVQEAVVRHAELVRAEESWWHAQVEAHWSGVVREELSGRLALDCAALASLHPALQRRILRRGIERLQGHLQRIYAVHIEALRNLGLGAAGGAHLDLPGCLRAWRRGASLMLWVAATNGQSEAVEAHPATTFDGPGEYRFHGWEWALDFISPLVEHRVEGSGPNADDSVLVARMDADRLLWPLHVRTWVPGDRFMPLGLQGMKKLQDFFVDRKVERNRRRLIPLLCDQEKICWVAGLQIDERVKVTPHTRRVLVVRLRSRFPISDLSEPGGQPHC